MTGSLNIAECPGVIMEHCTFHTSSDFATPETLAALVRHKGFRNTALGNMVGCRLLPAKRRKAKTQYQRSGSVKHRKTSLPKTYLL